MRSHNAIITCIILAFIISVPSLVRIPSMFPFLDKEVRAKAPFAIEEMRKHGAWMVNANLESVSRENGKVCFNWIYAYRSRAEPDPEPESVPTCL